MWMDAYIDEILVREQIREAQESAARRHAVRSAAHAAARPSGRLARLFGAVARPLFRHAEPRSSVAPEPPGVVPLSGLKAGERLWPRFALDVAVWP